VGGAKDLAAKGRHLGGAHKVSTSLTRFGSQLIEKKHVCRDSTHRRAHSTADKHHHHMDEGRRAVYARAREGEDGDRAKPKAERGCDASEGNETSRHARVERREWRESRAQVI